MRKIALSAVAALMVPFAAAAHHSFAVFFDETQIIELEGQVTAFRFTNPHGTIALDVVGEDGAVEHWRLETNAPVVLRRRGWHRRSVTPGDVIRVDGWPARDGKNYMRLRSARNLDGQLIGQTFMAGED